MKNVGGKAITERVAVAQAILDAPAAVIARLRDGGVDKGDALEMARAAAYLAAKRTPDLLPLCHPLLLDKIEVRYEFTATAVTVIVEVGTQARTGVEMEALTAAAIAALTLYDMLKPHAGTDLMIHDVLLLKKTGGKSHFLRA